MTLEELEKISAAICDSHKCGYSCPNRQAPIDNWDGAANCFNSFRYPGYEDFLNDHPAILKAALLKMTKKIKAHLDFGSFAICQSPNDLMFYVRGYFDKLAFKYRDMTISEIRSNLEDLKIVFEFLDKKGYMKNEPRDNFIL